jgi:hypothetical protein
MIGSIVLEEDENGQFVERHIAKTPTELNAALGGDASAAWPVGSVFTSVVSTNPATLLGFGTWSSIATGQVLIGLDSEDTDFDTAEKTGGNKVVESSAQTFAGNVNTTSAANTGATKIGSTTSTATLKAHTHTLTPTGTNTPGAATSVVQPYFVVYFWKRTE